ncbi:MAG TPA: S53 family peptidase [Acidimicrobiales bacterium]|nr:S53 family peptidase [Acidimicrobiales bacterium]
MGTMIGLGTPGAGAAPAQTAAIPGSASPAARRDLPLGAVAPGTGVRFAVVLAPRHPAAAAALALAVSTPGTAVYRHFLTPAQWEARFSPTRSQVAEVEAWLRGRGLRVVGVTPDRLTVTVTGTSAGVERTFGTTLGWYRVAGRRLQLAAGPLSVPVALSGVVTGTLGLDQAPAVPQVAAPPAQETATPCAGYYGQAWSTTVPPYGNGYPSPLPYAVCGYTPAQLRTAYGVSADVAGGDTGRGETVAVVDAYSSSTLLADAQHEAAVDDPGAPFASSQFSEIHAGRYDDKGTCDAPGWLGEGTLDVEAVHAMAPGAHIVYVAAKNCLAGLYTAFETAVDRHVADIISASWGDDGGDVVDDAGTRAAVENALTMAAGTGISVIFASGDEGDEFSELGQDAADFPASSPWVTAVGATTLELGFGIQEEGWSSASSYRCTGAALGIPGCSTATLGTWLPLAYRGGSGGGTSVHYPQPSYQAGVVPSALATAHAAVTGTAPMRVEPDVAMDGDPATGFLEGLTETFPTGARYGQYRAGGTSLSAPLFAGVVALAAQRAGRSLGFLNPALYAMARAHTGLVDVVRGPRQAQTEIDDADPADPAAGTFVTTRIVDYQGAETYCPPSGGTCRSAAVSLSTGPGYDDMTGVGSPALGFVAALARS